MPPAVINLIAINTPINKTTPTARLINTFSVKPATMYVTKETAATVNAYGSWVDTWFT